MYLGLKERSILKYFCVNHLNVSAWKTLELCYDEMSRVVRNESGGNWHKFGSICKCFIEF